MNTLLAIESEVVVDIVRSDRLTELLKESYEADDQDENMVTTSMMVRPQQKKMISALAKSNRLSQGDIIRIIIDEWTQKKLEGCR